MTDWELITDILREMVDSGKEVILGPHIGMAGYYACFFDPDDMPSCKSCKDAKVNWFDCGHGETLLEAVEMARAIALDIDVHIPSESDFLS